MSARSLALCGFLALICACQKESTSTHHAAKSIDSAPAASMIADASAPPAATHAIPASPSHSSTAGSSGDASPIQAETAEPSHQTPMETNADSQPQRSPDDGAAAPTVRTLVEEYDDAVVYLTAQDAMGNDVGFGSGFMIDKSGLIATNYHVVRVASRLKAQTKNGQFFEVEGYCAADPKRDLVIVKLSELPAELEFFRLQDVGELQTGDELIAIGHPQGFRYTASTGIVSAVRRTDELPDDYRAALSAPEDTVWIQTNAAISAGSSGGPLLNRRGDLVGVNTWVAAGQNLGFATHAQHLRELTERLHDARKLPVRHSPAYYSCTEPEVNDLLQVFAQEMQRFVAGQQNGGLLGPFRKPKNPCPAYAEKLWTLAENRRGTDAAFEALTAVFALAKYDDGEKSYLKKAADRLCEDHLLNPQLDKSIMRMISAGQRDLLPVLREALVKAQDPEIQGLACYAIADTLYRTREAHGQDDLELVTLLERVTTEFGDVALEGPTLKELAEWYLIEVKHKLVGRKPLALTGQDVDGTPLSLEQLRGRVVLLDFWADWCPYCRVMYPQERELLEKFNARPFSILGVNADEKDRYQRVREAGEVTWPSIYDGQNGPIVKQWKIDHFPSLFVIDKYGYVRGVDVREAALSSLIDELMDQFYYSWKDQLIDSGATWRYVHDGNVLSENWKDPGFDDSEWQSGVSPVGYGHFDEKSLLAFGPDSQHKPITSFFRHRFQVADPAAIRNLVLSIRCDSGAVVYLNGHEVARLMLAVDAAPQDPSVDRLGMHDLVVIDPAKLQQGENLLAVELHQADPADATARLELELISGALDQLLQTVRDEQALYRVEAITGLGKLGPAAAAAVPDLEALTTLDDLSLAVHAQRALALIQLESRWQTPLPQARSPEEAAKRIALATPLAQFAVIRAQGLKQPLEQCEKSRCEAFAARYLAPELPVAQWACGLAEFRLGNSSEAIAILEKSVQDYGPTPFACVVLALAKLELNQVDESKKELERARSLMGNPMETTAALQLLLNEADERLKAISESPPQS